VPTDKNVPPFDSFEHEHNVPEKHVHACGDPLLTAILNPPKGQDRVAGNDYERVPSLLKSS
jgi:hypothetical protein